MDDSRRNVRRRLFQDDESMSPRAGEGENITNSLLEQMKLQADEAKSRWNFDFEKEEPLPGRWEWVKKGDERFENFGTDDDNEEYFLANDQLDNGENSNDTYVDASNLNMPSDLPETSTPNNNPTEPELVCPLLQDKLKQTDNNNSYQNNN